jgi:hypothetical protein
LQDLNDFDSKIVFFWIFNLLISIKKI